MKSQKRLPMNSAAHASSPKKVKKARAAQRACPTACSWRGSLDQSVLLCIKFKVKFKNIVAQYSYKCQVYLSLLNKDFLLYFWYTTHMRLKTFLIIFGLWVAFLPHIGFSIATENVLFSISGFICIVASFYVAAMEDRHKNKRIIQDTNLHQVSEKISSKLQFLRKEKKMLSTTDSKNRIQNPRDISASQENTPEDDGRPRIRKAVSDVKINMDSIDDIVS